MKKEKKKDSPLSIVACILSFFTCTCWIGFIIALIDLAKGDKTKRHLGSGFAIVVSIIVLLYAIGTYGSDDNKDTAEPDVIEVTEQSSGDTEQIAEQKEVSTTESKANFNVDGLEVKMVKCSKNFKNYDSTFNKPKDGCKYVRAVFTFTNNSDDSKYVSLYDFDCYADDDLCEQVFGVDDTDFINTNLSPGRKVKFGVVYEVPKDAKEIELEYKNVIGDTKAIYKIK